MGVTPTDKHGLSKQASGDVNWHVPLNSTLDEIDDRLPYSYAGDPNGNVAGKYIGQLYWDSTAKILYSCITTGDASTAQWDKVATPSKLGLVIGTDVQAYSSALDAVQGTNTGDEVQATESVAGIAEIATQAEVDAGTDNTRIVTPQTLTNSAVVQDKIIYDTAQATTSGTSVSFTSVPAKVKAIQILLNEIGTGGASAFILSLRVGTAGGLANTGYKAQVASWSSSGARGTRSNTTYFPLIVSTSYMYTDATVTSNNLVLTRVGDSSNDWILSGLLLDNEVSNSPLTQFVSGTVSLTDELSQVSLIISGGNFGSGSMNLLYYM